MALQVSIVSRQAELFRGEATHVAIPTVTGSLGILPGRQPLLAAMQAGTVDLTLVGGGTRSIDVDEGFASVDEDEVTIVVDRQIGDQSE
ncbi:hypothetical protein H8R18_02625 [Nanchangia anserum]|uniref:ATP synthase F1 complex delta/epsilon subunit N-terminal domain-containing protein n=1 Tax=Nanchangia anserum TaxID=2692125 RepID=A0A8I0KP30_9ACTO|nr:hypothetical protein [Nanchangia anserum]MBD3689931.1 hypothetical protein [Nanchangia anserum]QOX82254.1 hypothetical protein H8R18_02625 [Nanchangia anserum]